MARPSRGQVPTASEEPAGATWLRAEPGSLGPPPPEQKAPPLLPPPSCPQKAQPEGLQEDRDPGSPERRCGVLGGPAPAPSPPFPPTWPLPTLVHPSPCPSPSPVSCSPVRPPLQGRCLAVLGLRRSRHCLMCGPNATPSSATSSGCALAPVAVCPGRRSYRKGQVSAWAPASPPVWGGCQAGATSSRAPGTGLSWKGATTCQTPGYRSALRPSKPAAPWDRGGSKTSMPSRVPPPEIPT